MANLSADTKKRLVIALTSESAGKEVADQANRQASSISALGVLTPGVDQATTNANIASIQAKVDSILAALKAAKLMA